MSAVSVFSMQGRAVRSARLVHTQEVAGSNPAPATNPEGVARPVGCARSGHAGEKDRRFPSYTTERRGQRTDCADVTAGETAPILFSRVVA